MSITHCFLCPCSICAEHCNDYLLLLEELMEAEAIIEELQSRIDLLQELFEGYDAEDSTGKNR